MTGSIRRALEGAGARRPLLLEAFVAFNLSFLVLDVYLAHSSNAFENEAEWIPFAFAGAGALALIANLFRGRRFDRGRGRTVGLVVGGGAVLVGSMGMVLHLESRFFQELTLRSLVYSAPFVAPLSFAGLGFLLLLNRMVDAGSVAWSGWVLFLAWCGFGGNFALSLADHAQNGFFYANEWVPVVMAAIAVGYLFTILVRSAGLAFLDLGFWVLIAEALIGVAGFGLHLRGILRGAGSLAQRVIYGPPPFAPLLFTNLALLAALGLWDLRDKRATREVEEGSESAVP